MILVLGASGFIGQAFCRELRRRGIAFVPLSRIAFDYTRFDLLFEYVRKIRPVFLINAAGYSGRPNMDGCEEHRMAAFLANAILPQTIAQVCVATNTPWAHVSSGGIYSGAKVFEDGKMRVVKDLNSPELRRLFDAEPDRFFGFTEFEKPNSTFRALPCSFLSGTKALAEEVLQDFAQCYVWRARMPFGEKDEPCNLLSKLWHYPRVYDHVTSLTHVDDFARAGLDLWERHAPFGTYNMTNPGAVTTRQVVEMMRQVLKPSRRIEFWANDLEFYSSGARAPRSSCILDVTKLLGAGVKMRPVKEALADALKLWRPGLAPLSLLATSA
jgi:dTDP-4-dehydrorhamnose reductase